MFDKDFEDDEFISKIEEMIEKSLMIKNVINGINDFSIDAINFPTLSKVFYLDCYISKRGNDFMTPDNIPFEGRTLH